MPDLGGWTPPALSNILPTAAEPERPDFLSGSLDLCGTGVEEVLPWVSRLPESLLVEESQDWEVRTCELLRGLLPWMVSTSIASSPEEALLSAFPCPFWLEPALAVSWTRALSSNLEGSRVMVTCKSTVFLPVTAEDPGTEVVVVAVVDTAWVTAGLEVVTVVVVEGGALVLPEVARGTTVPSAGFLKAAWNPSVVPCG